MSRILLSMRFTILAPAIFLGACADNAPGDPPSWMSLGSSVAPPVGSLLLCRQDQRQCAQDQPPREQVEMTPKLWNELRAVQRSVNREIKPENDRNVAWHYAVDGGGNCVQYALEKRRTLRASGVPAGALQLATAVVPGNIGHLVLVVDTTQGDWVLDNLRPDIVRWDELPYRWVERQDGASMSHWVVVITSRS